MNREISGRKLAIFFGVVAIGVTVLATLFFVALGGMSMAVVEGAVKPGWSYQIYAYGTLFILPYLVPIVGIVRSGRGSVPEMHWIKSFERSVTIALFGILLFWLAGPLIIAPLIIFLSPLGIDHFVALFLIPVAQFLGIFKSLR